MSEQTTPETDAECPYCKAMPMGMIAKVRWTCGSYGGPTGRSERCKERANAWEQRDVALRERDEAREELEEYRSIAENIGAKKAVSEKEEAIRERDEWEAMCGRYKQERDDLQKAINGLCEHFKISPANTTLLAVEVLRIERERDEARESLKHIEEYGTEEINAAVELRQKLASALVERDEAQKELSSIYRWIERNHADGFIDSLTYLKNLERVMDCWYDRLDKMERERDEWKNKAYSHATDYTLMEAKCFRLEQQLKEYDKLKS